MQTIAFLGLGAMGARMAAHLVKAGYPVTVWNRDPAKAAPLQQQDATLVATARAAAQGADVVISMVTDDTAARSVWLDAQTGALDGLQAGAIAIECSTVTPTWVRQLAEAVHSRGAHLLDAPVVGSRPQADAAQLILMVGGAEHALEQVRPVLSTLAAKLLHVGAVGQGAVLKLAVNALFAAQLQSVAELLGFLTRNGYAPEQAANLLGEFPVVAPPIAGAAKMMAAKNTAPLFTIDLIEKDLGYLLDTASASGADLPSASVARTAFQRAQQLGLGAANVSGLAAVFA
ncbi:NAD(P)-dependent oxidoreductase [Rhodoferax sp.]|uniref:NAD(P)-dependent oxidoreductase n=1 Tax=Rhodoferax sp. TaxID=50421 RepID=UPI002ACED8D7|nr:NAD(P)-dependent oxidoreductase [Rhodoferax sp.]MDZ7919842.1 NAD(P)-dependent oxidoreductase [Rhodoferax sp.]